MSKVKLSIFILVTISCGVTSPRSYTAHSDKFTDRYVEYLQPNEEAVYTWYHYVTSRTPNKEYIVRTFFPETKQLTSKRIFKDKYMRVLNGRSEFWYDNGILQASGDYINNRAEGIWEYYHETNGEVSQKGEYKLGKKNGEWKSYDDKGRIIRLITYKNDVKEGPFAEFDSLGVELYTGTYKSNEIEEFYRTEVSFGQETQKKEQMPFMKECAQFDENMERVKCTSQALLDYVYSNVKYPPKARKYILEGTALTTFVIDEQGGVTDVEVVSGLNEEIKNQCYEIISNMRAWEPGIQMGKAVKVRYSLPITYRIK